MRENAKKVSGRLFEKKLRKKHLSWERGRRHGNNPRRNSFFASFFDEKEVLSSFASHE